MKTISIEVKDTTAKKLEYLTEEKKIQLARLIDLWITEPGQILKVMEEMGEYAAKQGLTQEKLDRLLEVSDEDKLWLSSISSNPAFGFLKDDTEDIYNLTDGSSIND